MCCFEYSIPSLSLTQNRRSLVFLEQGITLLTLHVLQHDNYQFACDFQTGLLIGGLSSLLGIGRMPGFLTAEGPHDMEAGFPPEQGGGHSTFDDLMCKVTHHDATLFYLLEMTH